MKKLFAIIMSVLMIACFMPTMAFAGEGGAVVGPTNYITVNGDATQYSTFSEAVNAAAQQDGIITYRIYGKVEASGSDQWIDFVKNRENVISVNFIGMTDDAEISVVSNQSILGVQDLNIDVSFEHLKLTHPNGVWVNDLGHATYYFSCMVRKANHTVTYTDCVFPNGVCDNMYGKTVFTNCKFTNAASKYNLWNYGGNTTVTDCEFTGTRGIKLYNEGTKENPPTISVKDTTFTDLTEKPALVVSKPANIELVSVKAENCNRGIFQRDIEGESDEKGLTLKGTEVNGTFNIKSATTEDSGSDIEITAGTFTTDVSRYIPSGMKIIEGEDGSFTVALDENAVVAIVDSVKYVSLQKAIAAAKNGGTIVLVQDIPNAEGISVPSGKNFVLDFAQHTYTLTGPGAGSKNTETNGFQLLKDSTITFKNGTIRIAENANSVKRIIQNYADLTLENMQIYAENQVGGENYPLSFNNGNVVFKGNTNITTTQDDTIAFDVYFWKNSYPNGVSVTFDESYTGKINGKIVYDSVDSTKASLTIKGNGSFGVIEKSAETTNGHKISISGGTFTTDPTPYVTEDYKAAKGSDGKWTVAKKSNSGGGGASYTPVQSALDKAKAEANTALANAAAANKYDDAQQAEIKSILDKAAADIKDAKTEDEVKAIKDAAQAEIDKVLTSEENAQIKALSGVDKDIFKAKSKYSKLRGKRAVKITWNVPKGMKLDGYEVFRSTKRYSGFGTEPYFTTSKTSYVNNKGLVRGKTYYYKVRGFVEINGERYYTGFSTKAFRVIK